MEERKYKFKFKLEAGMFFRKKIRDVLLDMKQEIEFNGSEFHLEESKGLFESTFFVKGICSKNELENIKKWGNNLCPSL